MSQRLVTILQVAGAALGIPAAAAGTYSAYHNYFSPEATCQRLRTNIVAIMERHLGSDAKHALLRKDVAEFDKTCGESDPDARTIFLAALQDVEPPARAARKPTLAAAAPEPAAQPAAAGRKQPLEIFGATGSAGQHGWVVLSRKDESSWVVNFSGHTISEASLPPAGTVLTAQRLMPVWSEFFLGKADQTRLHSRLPDRACVRVLATRAAPARLWAEVAPASCS